MSPHPSQKSTHFGSREQHDRFIPPIVRPVQAESSDLVTLVSRIADAVERIEQGQKPSIVIHGAEARRDYDRLTRLRAGRMEG